MGMTLAPPVNYLNEDGKEARSARQIRLSKTVDNGQNLLQPFRSSL